MGGAAEGRQAAPDHPSYDCPVPRTPSTPPDLPSPTGTEMMVAVPGLARFEEDLAFLRDCFAEVLREAGRTDLARLLPWGRGEGGAGDAPGAASAQDLPEGLEPALSVSFQLLNMCEERLSFRMRRRREDETGLAAEPGLWGARLQEMLASEAGGEEILAALASVRVEPVLDE